MHFRLAYKNKSLKKKVPLFYDLAKIFFTTSCSDPEECTKLYSMLLSHRNNVGVDRKYVINECQKNAKTKACSDLQKCKI